MPGFNFELFSKEELRAFEDLMTNALVRAGRILAREGIVTGWKPPVEEGPAEAKPQVPAPAAPHKLHEVPRPIAAAPPPPPPAQAKTKRAPRRSVAQVVKTVGERPTGYITVDAARDLIGRDSSTQSCIGRWIMDKEIPAVIVAGYKPPTKGLPGRLMVLKEALLARDKQRKENVATLPSLKRWQPVVAERELERATAPER